MFLRDLTWIEAEKVLTPEAIVVLPIGAAAKEHGPHLRLDNDQVLVEAWARLLDARTTVVILPTLTYHFYPAFAAYPGSTSLRLETARDLVVDVVLSIKGPRRFYALNSGVSTLRALAPAKEELAKLGVVFHYTDLLATLAPIEKDVAEQARGTHADEIETSLMLHLAPDRVDMSRAVKDDHPHRPGGLTRDPKGQGTYSASGVWGDATLATAEKGRIVTARLIDALVADIERLSRA